LNTNEKESDLDVLKGILIIPLRVGVSNDIDWIPLYRSSKLGIKGIDLVGPKEWPILKSMV
jgi:hydroxypyruvate isomerase